MLARLVHPPTRSFFLFGPRGTGKTEWLNQTFPGQVRIDLLDGGDFGRYGSHPERLEDLRLASPEAWILIDEIQRAPELLNQVHRLIELRGQRFGMTGSSARKLRRSGANLLAGRAAVMRMHPLTAAEIGLKFDLRRALTFGTLPRAYTTDDPREYLSSYVDTYLREEVQQEGIVRSLAVFTRFLQAATFSQGSVLNMAAVARDCHVSARVVENYFTILDDLLIAVRLETFGRRAKRRVISHPKFYLFDPGVYRALRPRGPLDTEEEIDGAALETLVLSHLRAINDAFQMGYSLHYWRTEQKAEVDFVLYGERGLVAIEVKRSDRPRSEDFDSLLVFREDYPESRAYLLHLGRKRWVHRGIEVVPVEEALRNLREILEGRDPGIEKARQPLLL